MHDPSGAWSRPVQYSPGSLSSPSADSHTLPSRAPRLHGTRPFGCGCSDQCRPSRSVRRRCPLDWAVTSASPAQFCPLSLDPSHALRSRAAGRLKPPVLVVRCSAVAPISVPSASGGPDYGPRALLSVERRSGCSTGSRRPASRARALDDRTVGEAHGLFLTGPSTPSAAGAPRSSSAVIARRPDQPHQWSGSAPL